MAQTPENGKTFGRSRQGPQAPRPLEGPRTLPPYDIYRRFRRILLDCDSYRSVEALGRYLLESLVDESGETSPAVCGRLFRARSEHLVLIAEQGLGGSSVVGLKLPRDHPDLDALFTDGYLVVNQGDRPEDQLIESSMGALPLAVFTIGPQRDMVIALTLATNVNSFYLEPAIAALNSISELGWGVRAQAAELAQAAEVQTSLLSGVEQNIEGYELAFRQRPAEIVGGDFYDVTELASGTSAVTIGDATGHGLSAALQARDAVTGLRMGLQQQLRAVAMLSQLDKVLARSAARGRFVSLCYLELDRRGNFIYVNAGHPSPLIVDTESGRARSLVSTGPVLGLPPFARRSYRREFDRLGPSEILVAYTDGVAEATDKDENELGEQSLVEACVHRKGDHLDSIVEDIFHRLDLHSDPGAPQADDQTVLLLRTRAPHLQPKARER